MIKHYGIECVQHYTTGGLAIERYIIYRTISSVQ